MNDISKAAQYRSFYDVAKKLQDPMTRLALYDAIDAYRFDGIEPEHLPFEADLAFTVIRPIIDKDLKNKRGGAPTGNTNAVKNKDTTENNLKQPLCFFENNPQNNIENNLKQPVEFKKTKVENNLKNNSKQPVDLKKTNNVNDNDNVNDNGNGNGNVDAPVDFPAGEINAPEESTTPPLNISTNQQNYAKEIFELFKNAGLPCRNGNFVSFLQADFKNSLEKLRGQHSGEVLQTVKNYIEILQDPSCYVSFKYSFETFVNSKLYAQCQPANFIKDNFKNFETAAAKTQPAPEKKKDYPKPPAKCSECGTKVTQHYMLDHYSFFCPTCHETYKYKEGAWILELDYTA